MAFVTWGNTLYNGRSAVCSVVTRAETYQKYESLCTSGFNFDSKPVARDSGTTFTPMTHQLPHHPEGTDRKPSDDPSVAGGIALLAVLAGVLVAASYPVATAVVVGTLAAAVLLARSGIPALGRRLHGRVTELEVPGFGTVRIRVTAR